MAGPQLIEPVERVGDHGGGDRAGHEVADGVLQHGEELRGARQLDLVGPGFVADCGSHAVQHELGGEPACADRVTGYVRPVEGPPGRPAVAGQVQVAFGGSAVWLGDVHRAGGGRQRPGDLDVVGQVAGGPERRPVDAGDGSAGVTMTTRWGPWGRV